MPLIPGPSQSFELTPPGVFKARCYRIIDLGTHLITGQFGAANKRQVQFTFELADSLMEDKRPFSIRTKRFTLSLHENAALKKFLDSWRGVKMDKEEAKTFDILTLIGQTAMVSVVHVKDQEMTYANIDAIMPLKTEDCPKAVNKPFIFTFEDFNKEAFSQLSDKMKEWLENTPEYRKLMVDVNIEKLKPKIMPEKNSDNFNYEQKLKFFEEKLGKEAFNAEIGSLGLDVYNASVEEQESIIAYLKTIVSA